MPRWFTTALVVSVLAAACGGVTDPSKNTLDTKTGTIPVGGADVQFFSVSRSGEMTIIVTNLTPAVSSSTFFGVGYGLAVSGQCQPFGVNLAVLNSTAVNTQITPGSYCLIVADQGSFKVPETYTALVSHP
jgi:hypothetical protein